MGTLGIVAIILSALASIGTGVANYLNIKKTNEANQQQYEDWKSYNSPSNQMQRLSDAGLNPYLVSNVNNTLSQPFQFGQNSGIAEALSGVANVGQGVAQYAGNAVQREKDREIQRQNIAVKQKQLELNQLGLNIREKLANMNLKIGDYRGALLATQGSIAELNKRYLQSSLPYRLNDSLYSSLYNQLRYNYYKELFPQQLHFYAPMQRAMINNILGRNNHLKWYEDFAFQQLMQQQRQWRENRSDRYYFHSTPSLYDQQRLGLSRDYYDLARDKFHWNIMDDIMQLGFGK